MMQSQPQAHSAYPWCHWGESLCLCRKGRRLQVLLMWRRLSAALAPENEEKLFRPSAPRTAQTTGCQPDSCCWEDREGYTGDSTDHNRSNETNALFASVNVNTAIAKSKRRQIISKWRIPRAPKRANNPRLNVSRSTRRKMWGEQHRVKSRCICHHRCISSSVIESELCPSWRSLHMRRVSSAPTVQ